MEYPADPLDHDDFALHQAAKPIIQVLIFRKPPVAADIEFVAVLFHGNAKSANIAIAFEDGNPSAMPGKLVTCSKTGGTRPENNGMLCGMEISVHEDAAWTLY
ncbi:MAG: hypothetical protein L0Y57_05290 [Beijerinckiaceae bacterium]|nr:hypothetical protein [Beijerinckiaceae bacterium]